MSSPPTPLEHAGSRLTIALGKGHHRRAPFVADLGKNAPPSRGRGDREPGKSVSLNAMISSLLFKVSPDMVQVSDD